MNSDVPGSIRRTDAYRRVLDVGTVFYDAWLELLAGLPEGAPVPIEGTVLFEIYIELQIRRELEVSSGREATRARSRREDERFITNMALAMHADYRVLLDRAAATVAGGPRGFTRLHTTEMAHWPPLPKEPERHHDTGSSKAAEGEGGEPEDTREGGEGNGPA